MNISSFRSPKNILAWHLFATSAASGLAARFVRDTLVHTHLDRLLRINGTRGLTPGASAAFKAAVPAVSITMALYLKDLIEDPRLLDRLSTKQPNCRSCGVELQETITGKRSAPQGEVCSDCYYELLGELIEQHPIVSAGIRRG